MTDFEDIQINLQNEGTQPHNNNFEFFANDGEQQQGGNVMGGSNFGYDNQYNQPNFMMGGGDNNDFGYSAV